MYCITFCNAQVALNNFSTLCMQHRAKTDPFIYVYQTVAARFNTCVSKLYRIQRGSIVLRKNGAENVAQS